MQFEEKIEINAPAEVVFRLYSEVENWPKWDPDVKSSSIEGEFVSGSKGTIKPTNGPKAKILFVQITPNKSFTVESRLPLCKMRFEHEITSLNSNMVSIVHRVSFIGLLSNIFGLLIGTKIKKGLPGTMSGLKMAAEKHG